MSALNAVGRLYVYISDRGRTASTARAVGCAHTKNGSICVLNAVVLVFAFMGNKNHTVVKVNARDVYTMSLTVSYAIQKDARSYVNTRMTGDLVSWEKNTSVTSTTRN